MVSKQHCSSNSFLNIITDNEHRFEEIITLFCLYSLENGFNIEVQRRKVPKRFQFRTKLKLPLVVIAFRITITFLIQGHSVIILLGFTPLLKLVSDGTYTCLHQKRITLEKIPRDFLIIFTLNLFLVYIQLFLRLIYLLLAICR